MRLHPTTQPRILHRNCNAAVHIMKTANFPSLRVDPELRKAAEDVLGRGESLSAFLEESVRANIERRKAQQAFIERGLASRQRAARTGHYVPAAEVLQSLSDRLERARRR